MDLQLAVNGKPVNATLALPASGKGSGVLVLHAWWGLKPFFQTVCARLAEQGFVVLAPDMNNGEIARSVDEAKALMDQRDSQATQDIVLASKDFLLSHPACTSQKIGVVGFSMGAAWSVFLASNSPEQVAATVVFYGGPGVNCGKIQSKVLGHFSDKDEWEPLDGIQTMEKSMRAAGVDVTLHIYPGLGHWFVEDDRPEYNSEASRLAWERTFAFLKDNL